jgi:hypothetical protein
MSLIKYKYDSSDTILYQTDLYSGGDADVAATELFTNVISLDENMYANIDFKFLGNNAVTDLSLRLYKALTNTFDGDEILLGRFMVGNDASEDIFSFMLKPSHAPGFFRFGITGSGSTTYDIEVKTRLSHFETV